MAKDLAVVVGKQIRRRRLAAGMQRQRELAERMVSPTISNQTVSDWERGIHQPSDENLRELAEILDCKVADFFADERPETPDAMAALNGHEDSDRLARIERLVEGLDEQVRQLRVDVLGDDAEGHRRSA